MAWFSFLTRLGSSGPVSVVEVPDPPGDQPELPLGDQSGNFTVDFVAAGTRTLSVRLTGNSVITSLTAPPRGYCQLRILVGGAFTLTINGVTWVGPTPVFTPNTTSFANFFTDADGVVWGQVAP